MAAASNFNGRELSTTEIVNLDIYSVITLSIILALSVTLSLTRVLLLCGLTSEKVQILAFLLSF